MKVKTVEKTMRVIRNMILMVLLTIFEGLTFSTLWNWFAAPIVDHRITTAAGVGLVTLIAFATHQYDEYSVDRQKDGKGSNFGYFFALKFMVCLITLLVGFLAKLCL